MYPARLVNYAVKLCVLLRSSGEEIFFLLPLAGNQSVLPSEGSGSDVRSVFEGFTMLSGSVPAYTTKG